MIKLTEPLLHAIISLRNDPAFKVLCRELGTISEEMTAEFMAGIPDPSDVNAQKREDVTRGVVMTLYTLNKCFENPEEALETIRIINLEAKTRPTGSSV